MQQINLYGKIHNGKLELNNREALNQWCSNLKEGEDIVVKFNVSKTYKSTRQLRLLYHCFRELSAKLGYGIEEIKMLMKLRAGLCFVHTIEGEEISVCKSISDMTKRELSEFVEFVDIWSTTTLNHPLLKSEDIKFLKDV